MSEPIAQNRGAGPERTVREALANPDPEDRGVFWWITAWILQNRLWALLILVAVVVLSSVGMARLRIAFDAGVFFSSDDPELAYLADYHERWGQDDLLVVAVDGGEASMLTPERIAVLREITEKLRSSEHVVDAASLATLPRLKPSLFGPPLPVDLETTLPEKDAAPEAMTAWREDLLTSPMLVPNFLSKDATTTAILVRLNGNSEDLSEVRIVVQDLERLLEPLDGKEDVRIHFAGIPALRAGVIDAIVGDQILFVPISALVVSALLASIFRSRHGVFVPLLASALPLVMMLGLMGWFGEDIGLLNQILFVLIPSMAIAEAIHVVSRFHEESRRLLENGAPPTVATRAVAIAKAMQAMGTACFLTVFTTVIGFLSMLTTEMTVLRSFGVWAGLGITLSYFTFLFAIPLTLSVTRLRAHFTYQDEHGPIGRLLGTMASMCVRRPVTVLAVTVVLVGIAIWGAFIVRVDTVLTSMMDPRNETTIANHLVDQKLGGVVGLEFELTGAPEDFEKPEVLAVVARIEQEARSSPEVLGTASPASLVAEANATMWGKRQLPDDPAWIPVLLQLSDIGSGMTRLVSEDHSRGRLVVRTHDIGANALLDFAQGLDAKIQKDLEGSGIKAHLTGSTFVTYRGMTEVTTDLRSAFGYTFFLCIAIVAVMLRSVSLGAHSLIPNTLPILMAYGAVGLMGWNLDIAPAVVFAVALGLAVDNTIHVLARFKEERAHGRSYEDAAHEAVVHSGRAIAITSFILIMGFGINIFSSFPANATFGALGAIIIVLGVVVNLFVLPAQLVLAHRVWDRLRGG